MVAGVIKSPSEFALYDLALHRVDYRISAVIPYSFGRSDHGIDRPIQMPVPVGSNAERRLSYFSEICLASLTGTPKPPIHCLVSVVGAS